MAEQILSSHAALTPDVPHVLRHRAPVVVVVGDPMLDGWFCGTSSRIAREAPAPIVEITSRQRVPGGAANTAMNLAALGARVRFVGLAGADAAGTLLRDLLAGAGVDVSGLVLHPGVTTTTKDRIVVGDQVLVRLDDGGAAEHPPGALAELAREVAGAAAGADAVVVCDYGSGALRGPVHDVLVRRGARTALTVVDAHDPTAWADLRPDLATPNTDEAGALLGLSLRASPDRAATLADHGGRLLEATGAAAVVVTLDRDGTALLDADGLVHRTWARPATEKQASGAGDTFVAALTLARVCGLPLTTSADLAQSAADVVVTRPGTSVCSTTDLAEHLAGFADSAISPDDLVRRVEAERAAGRTIVLTNGCFDVLHRGHTTSLNQAKRCGDVLVVAINDDDSVRRLKGDGRPINPVHDRASVLAALSCVDYVTVFTQDTAVELIERVRPDVYAKGGDHAARDLVEADVVRALGGDVRILDYVPSQSTSAVVRRIQRAPLVPDGAGVGAGVAADVAGTA